ncbi:MAG: rhodanese-like domain-containing protein [Flavobacteriales bacterium]|nr:rhodanese-like domain-containing protein [Flavobacteriales bacterium]
MKEINVQEYKKLVDSEADYQLIDVREPYEYEIAHMDGELLPMGSIMDNLDKISKDKQVIVHCRSGKRSAAVVSALEKAGYENVYNLAGGITAYAQEIDPNIPVY